MRGSYRWCLVLGCLTMLVGPLAPVVAAPPPVTGSLETVGGVRVLKLWGTAYERGYAHGYLVGRDTVAMFTGAVLDPRVLADPQQYETGVRGGFATKMKIDPERREELKGLLDGIVAAVGPAGIRLERLNRNLEVGDLEAVNTMADWYRFMCSSFSVWGGEAGGGETITGRNLDFLTLPGLDTQHLLIVYLEPGAGKKRWVSLAWSGLIGAYTAMNEDGVTISMHDADGRKPSGPGPFVPRSLALRDAMEAATGAEAVADVRRVLSLAPSIGGNNIHVSSPFKNQPQPAAVFEYDGDLALDGGVTVRQGSLSPPPGWIVCTNHYVQRGEPKEGGASDSTRRYRVIEQALLQARQTQVPIDAAFARKVMADVACQGTMHTVVFFPNRKELWISLARPGAPAATVEPVRLRLEDLLRR